MLTPLTGRSVIVTGASKGIGRGIARRFGAVGANVLAVSRNLAEAEAVAGEIAAAGGAAVGFAADISDPAQAKAMAEAAIDRHGGIDILCANAGVFPPADLGAMTEADFDHVIGINLKGTFLSVAACLPAMKAKRGGRIIITSSITGPITGVAGLSHYGASKAGQLGFMRAAAIELAPWGITVNAVLPGNILTEGLASLGDAYLRKMEASVPLKRLGRVEDIAHTVLYLASDEAGYVTAQAIVVDGGQILPEGGALAPDIAAA